MTKLDTSNFPFTIFIFPYSMDQIARLDKNVIREKISFRMTFVQGHGCFCRKSLSVVFSDFFSSLESDDEMSNQPAWYLREDLPIAIVPPTISSIPKYTKENLQQIFKTVLEA